MLESDRIKEQIEDLVDDYLYYKLKERAEFKKECEDRELKTSKAANVLYEYLNMNNILSIVKKQIPFLIRKWYGIRVRGYSINAFNNIEINCITDWGNFKFKLELDIYDVASYLNVKINEWEE